MERINEDLRNYQLPLVAMGSSNVVHVKQTGSEGSGRAKATKISEYCHQCRQLAIGVVVACKKLKRNKLCTTRFCKRCLRNRYKEIAEEVTLLDRWHCPKCRGICNCSICRKQVSISPGMVMHTGSSDRAILDKERTKNLYNGRSIRGLHVDPKDVTSENHVIVRSNDEKKRKRVKDEIQDDTHCIPISRVMRRLSTSIGINRRVKDTTRIQDGTHCIPISKVMRCLYFNLIPPVLLPLKKRPMYKKFG